MKVAFYGRVSTDDAQDPSLSIPRQLAKCNEVLGPIGGKVAIAFWDVESGRKAPEERGKGGRDWTRAVKVPRAGGLPELLAAADAGEVDAVIVESIDRLSRMTADGTRIEPRLEEHDDPEHPVVKLAKERIEELDAQAESVGDALADLESVQPEGIELRKIEAILSPIPDLREQLEGAEGEELIELLDIFDVMISYDKPGQTLTTSVLLNSDFPNRPDASATGDRSQGSDIAGAGFGHLPATGYRFVAVRELP